MLTLDYNKILFLCLDKKLKCSIFKNQITTLIIEIDPYKAELWTLNDICNRIFSVCKNLTHLIVYESSYKNGVPLFFDLPSPKLSSSTLLVLNIKVQNFFMCLYLLDGRFNQLHTFHIELINIHPPREAIENQVSSRKNEFTFEFIFVFLEKNSESQVFFFIMCCGNVGLRSLNSSTS